MVMAVHTHHPNSFHLDEPLWPSTPRKRPRDDAVDALLHLHCDTLRSAIDHHSKSLRGAILSAALRHAQVRLREKDVELDAARRRTAELEARAMQLAAEGQIWLHVARDGEVAAASLRAALDQAIESGGREDVAAGDVESCCNEGEEEERARRSCRVCGETEVSVLLLPCRHLCVCLQCDPRVDTCPICGSDKSGSVEVFLA